MTLLFNSRPYLHPYSSSPCLAASKLVLVAGSGTTSRPAAASPNRSSWRALGYVLKNAAISKITHAIHAVAASKPVLVPRNRPQHTIQGRDLVGQPSPRGGWRIRSRPHGPRAGSAEADYRGPDQRRNPRQALHQQAYHRNPPPEHHRQNPSQKYGCPRQAGREPGADFAAPGSRFLV